jgi:hypothetical protein
MENLIEEFKEYWYANYNYISLDLEDYDIADFINRENQSISMACDRAADWLLSQGLAEVQE